jgi:hypothetical protein
MKKKLFNLLFCMLVLAVAASAQVTVSFTLRPPFSAYIKDYYRLENKAIIVLTNTTRTTQDIKLGGSISNGSRGIYIRTTPQYMPAMPITLGPGATTVLTANADVMRFFDQGNIVTNANDAMVANIIRSGMLPEGTYQICVNAYDYNSGKQLSNAGMGCFSFDISHANPPLITFPQNNHIYPAEQKNLNFSWTPPLGNLSGSLIEYDQVVVKVQPGQNPNDAIAAARDFSAGNPMLNKRGTLSQSYITQPYDLPFEPGTYAMQVVARDRNEKIILNNQGRSEVVVFQVGRGVASTVDDIVLADDGPTFTSTQLKGTLRYYWQGVSGTASNYNNFGNYAAPANAGNGNNITTQNNVRHNYYGFSGWQNSPLAGVTVQLVKAMQFINPVVGGSNQSAAPNLLPGNLWPNSSTVLATATTNSDGSFQFNVPSLANIDFGLKTNRISGGSGEFEWHIDGQHRTVLMIKISNGYYYANPIQFISGVPASGEMGTFYSRVRTFNCRVKVADNDHNDLVKPNLEVVFMRKDPRNLMVPRDEGHPGDFRSNPRTPSNPTSYEIVYTSTGVTDGNGEVLIKNIVLENCGNYGKSGYYIRSRNKDEYNTQHSLHHMTYDHIYAYRSQWSDPDCVPAGRRTMDGACGSMNCYAIAGIMNQYSTPGNYTPTEFYHIQGVYPIKPRVYTQVKFSAGGNTDDMAQNLPGARWCLFKLSKAAMQNAKLIAANGKWGLLAQSGTAGWNLLNSQLQNRGTPAVLERTGLTGADGRVNEELLPYEGAFSNPIGFYYVLTVEKTGFDTEVRVVNLLSGQPAGAGDVGIAMPGNAYKIENILLQPKGKVKLRLVNEQGDLIDGSAWYYDPVTGLEGQVENTIGLPQLWRIELDVPSGNNRKIVIQPSNEERYERDTITVNVPANETLEKEVVIKYKLHRIYFNIKNTNGQPVDRAKVELVEMPGDAAEMYNNLQSPWLYEGAHSPMPNNNPPGQSNNNQSNNNDYVNMNDGPQVTNPYAKFTNNGGGVDFAFRNSGTSFKFRITGPGGTFHYIVKEKTVTSIAGKNWKRVNVIIQLGRNVSGTVKFGQVPVANARVRVKTWTPMIEVFTNSQGEYLMKGVPVEPNLTFTASKQGYIGMEFTEGQSTQNVYGLVNYENMIESALHTTINFKLRIYDGLDLSMLLGFPLEVTNLEETAGARSFSGGSDGNNQSRNGAAVRISGIVTVSDSANVIFKMDGTSADGKRLNTIDFSDRLVVADDIKNDSGIPYCRPQTLPLQTDINQQPVKVYNFYQATLYDNTNGITLNNYGSGAAKQGVAQGRMRIEPTSFTDNSLGLENGQPICLVNGSSMQFPVFTANGPAVVNASQGIGIGNSSGGALTYSLHDFSAIANAGTSRLYKDSVILDTRLQTNLQHVPQPNLNLPIGKVKINKDRELENVSNVINVNMPLDSFRLQWKHIYINDEGVKFDAMLTAAGMNMPVSKATLYPNEFWIPQGTLETNNVKLLSTIPVQVTTNATFGYDATRSIPAWYLSITSESNDVAAAAISGQHLNGLDANTSIPLTSIWFYSNGDQYVTLRSNLPAYRIHNIVNFSLQSIFLNTNLVTLSGALDPGIPAFPNYNTALVYTRNDNNTISAMSLQPFSMPDIPVNGVVLGFNNGSSSSMQFSSGQLAIRGRIRDENPDVFKDVLYTLTKTNQEIKLVLDETPQKQTIQLGGSNSNSRIILSNIEGRMWVTNSAWNHLYFNGDMPEDMGFTGDGKRMRFDVAGALSVNSQGVKLKNMESPIDGLNMQYDMEAHRLLGGLHFANKVGTMAVEGDIEMVIDKLGYYFMAGGSMEMNNPQVTGQAFMLFGDYKHKSSDRKEIIEETLKRYSYYWDHLQELPNGYLNMPEVNGFFFEAGASIPFPGIPNFDIDLVLVSAALEVNVGGDVRLAMGFGETNMYNMGLGVWVDARFKLATSTVVACAGVQLSVEAGVDIDGTYWSNGDYKLTAGGFIKLEGEVWKGGLVCDADCEGIACISDRMSGVVELVVKGTVTHNDSSFGIEFGADSF